ncbi:MAG: flippase-like domain-containing protein, partial [Pseudomonadota bacterium]|nr:flippase-like domain-containing protein [Pseudomonadota bacterium]
VVRVFLCRPKMELPLAIHSVIIDRLAALAGLVALSAATLPWLAADLHFQALPAALSLAALVLAGLLLLLKAEAWLARFNDLHAVRALLYFAANVRLLFKDAPATLASAAISLATQFASCVAAWLLAASLGAHPTLLQCTTLVPPVMLAAMLPVSIGGWGVREAGMVAMLSLAGVPPETALLVSIQLGLLVALAASPGGLLWLKK